MIGQNFFRTSKSVRIESPSTGNEASLIDFEKILHTLFDYERQQKGRKTLPAIVSTDSEFISKATTPVAEQLGQVGAVDKNKFVKSPKEDFERKMVRLS